MILMKILAIVSVPFVIAITFVWYAITDAIFPSMFIEGVINPSWVLMMKWGGALYCAWMVAKLLWEWD